MADNARPKDYRIVKHVLHPNYTSTSRYNDIAVFRLEQTVEFSAHVRPICLNTDPLLTPPNQIATGWGRTALGSFSLFFYLFIYIYLYTISAVPQSVAVGLEKKKTAFDLNFFVCNP